MMSCSVLWKPVKNDGTYVGKGKFRDILEKKFGFPSVLSYSDIPYLEGLFESGHEEVRILIDALRLEGKIEIFLEC